MKCPHCNNPDTRVLESRAADNEPSVRRRRQCPACKVRFTTHEHVVPPERWVTKRNGTRVRYDRSKLRIGIEKALDKRRTRIEAVDTLVQKVENEVFNRERDETSTAELGALVLKHLKSLDKVAYIRFLSFHRQFKDLAEFEQEIRLLMKG